MKLKRCWHFWRAMYLTHLGIACRDCTHANLARTCNVTHHNGWIEYEEIDPPPSEDTHRG